MTTLTRKITAAEFWAMPDDPGHRYELVDGELNDMDGAPPHGKMIIRIGRLLGDYIDDNALPLEVGAATGFQMSPHTLRFPDVHVTTRARMAAYDEDAGGFPCFAPDVAIEVVSPSNTPAEMDRKTAEYFANGARAVWLAYPVPRTVAIRRPGMPEQILRDDAILRGDPEIPGFACRVSEIFAVLDWPPPATAANPGRNGRV